MKQNSMYHMILRTAALTIAFVLLFDSGLLSPVTKTISQHTQTFLATAIGMHASVVPTELNQYTAQLTERDHLLTQREAALAEREIKLARAVEHAPVDYSTYILSVLLFILLTLIVVNYILDFVRARERNINHTHEKVA